MPEEGTESGARRATLERALERAGRVRSGLTEQMEVRGRHCHISHHTIASHTSRSVPEQANNIWTQNIPGMLISSKICYLIFILSFFYLFFLSVGQARGSQ